MSPCIMRGTPDSWISGPSLLIYDIETLVQSSSREANKELVVALSLYHVLLPFHPPVNQE